MRRRRRFGAARAVALTVALTVVLAGCGDPLAEKLEATRPADEGPAKVVDEDGRLVDPPATTVASDPDGSESTTAPADPASADPAGDDPTADGATTPAPTTPPATTAPTDPTAARDAWVAQVMAICDEEYTGLATAEPPTDPGALIAQMQTVETAYIRWAERVEALPVPDRRTEANLDEGLRRLRRSIALLGPAVDLALAGDVAGARQAWWSWCLSITGASTALSAAGVPDACYL